MKHKSRHRQKGEVSLLGFIWGCMVAAFMTILPGGNNDRHQEAPTPSAPTPSDSTALADAPPAAVHIPAPVPAPPAPLEGDVVYDRATTLPKSCAKNFNATAMRQNVPQLANDLNLMRRLPLTGKPVHDAVTSPAAGIEACLHPVPEAQPGYTVNVTNYYRDRQITIGRGVGTTIAFHEYFHAYQDTNDGAVDGIFSLTIKDFAVGNMLAEASAVAFEMAARREAQNENLPFAVEEGHATFSLDAGNLAVFNAAYDAAAGQGEAKKLEAGGKAVVLRLVTGGDPDWTRFYGPVVMNNINMNLHMFSQDGRENRPGYAQARKDAYLAKGRVSEGFNFIPDQYLGPEAALYAEKSFAAMGLRLEERKPAAPRRAQGG